MHKAKLSAPQAFLLSTVCMSGFVQDVPAILVRSRSSQPSISVVGGYMNVPNETPLQRVDRLGFPSPNDSVDQRTAKLMAIFALSDEVVTKGMKTMSLDQISEEVRRRREG